MGSMGINCGSEMLIEEINELKKEVKDYKMHLLLAYNTLHDESNYGSTNSGQADMIAACIKKWDDTRR